MLVLVDWREGARPAKQSLSLSLHQGRNNTSRRSLILFAALEAGSSSLVYNNAGMLASDKCRRSSRILPTAESYHDQSRNRAYLRVSFYAGSVLSSGSLL